MVAATSVAAVQACPTMRGDALERSWCQSIQEGHARLSCSTGVKVNGSTAVVGDRHEGQVRIAATLAEMPWSFVSLEPSLLRNASRGALPASGAGPPLFTLRI